MGELNCTFLEFVLHQFCKDLDLGNSGLTVRAKHGGQKKRRKKLNCRAYRNPLYSVPDSVFVLDCFRTFSSTPKTEACCSGR